MHGPQPLRRGHLHRLHLARGNQASQEKQVGIKIHLAVLAFHNLKITSRFNCCIIILNIETELESTLTIMRIQE